MTSNAPDKRAPARTGHLVIIGGAEDRKHDKKVLGRFVELSGGNTKKIVVLTAASSLPDEMWEIYDEAFGDLGVTHRIPLKIHSREKANDVDCAAQILDAGGVFMTGGNQVRLLALIGGTAVGGAMHRAFNEHSVCIAGTSAGASAIPEHMLAAGADDTPSQKGASYLAAGLGFLPRVVIDQHFYERRRLGRLLRVVAQNPYLLGIGIDENTALVVERKAGLEVIGEGAVTIIDGREMASKLLQVGGREAFELLNVKLHLLPSGSRYFPEPDSSRRKDVPPELKAAISIITDVPEQ